jgi:hypothetical protein
MTPTRDRRLISETRRSVTRRMKPSWVSGTASLSPAITSKSSKTASASGLARRSTGWLILAGPCSPRGSVHPSTCATVGDMTRAELRHLARLGAEDRLRALNAEIALIHRAFPDLHEPAPPANPYTAGVRAAVAGVRPAVEGAVTRRRPRKMSAAGRRRIAEAAKRRWANWRAKQDEDKGAASAGTKAAAPGRRRTNVRDSHVKKPAKKGRARKKK